MVATMCFKQFQNLTVFLLLLLCVASCSQPPEPGPDVSWDDLTKQENQQQRVAVTGFLKVPTSIMATDTMLLPLHQTEEDESPKVSCSVKIGSGPNMAETPPKNYKESDLVLLDKDGNRVAPNSKIKVTGKLVAGEATTLLMGPLLIEKR